MAPPPLPQPTSSRNPNVTPSGNKISPANPNLRLMQAIDQAETKLLKSVLKDLCSKSPAFSEAVSRRLLISKRPLSSGQAEVDTSSSSHNNKRLRATEEYDVIYRHAYCQVCKQQFDRLKNEDGMCKYHPGLLITLEDNESDINWDEDPNPYYEPPQPGEPISPSKTEVGDYPECFKWDCCGQYGDGLGCIVTKHLALEPYNGP